MRTALMFVLVATVVTACGFKGPLYLPAPAGQQQAAP
ncbi:LPS translocon maturation chaperone LptM [Vogesella indigofera]|jgi:predicted small lipoprotein YifL|nr:lipoprotein [Vogesella indigofera]MDC7702841.1 lipoprotein [Vogesella indigofera]